MALNISPEQESPMGRLPPLTEKSPNTEASAQDIAAGNKQVSQLLEIGFNSKAKKAPNLQDAFLRYKSQRQKEIKRVRKRKDIPEEVRMRALADPDRMWALRMKFLERAKRYFGVPYAKRYWKAEDAEYHSPIFLDCCGLVRRVMRDLRKDFGFRLGPWNQCYQHDSLPLTITEDEMKPGDLVFISAIYHSKKSKKQKHNLTHVEIWLGDGPKTIGSRWNKGHVQVFDSYRFNPQAYHSEQYIFKSIDTWLMGICRSHCPEHSWKTRAERFSPDKRSIFNPQQRVKPVAALEPEAEDSSDESAGEGNDDPDLLESMPESATSPEAPAKEQTGHPPVLDKEFVERMHQLSLEGEQLDRLEHVEDDDIIDRDLVLVPSCEGSSDNDLLEVVEIVDEDGSDSEDSDDTLDDDDEDKDEDVVDEDLLGDLVKDPIKTRPRHQFVCKSAQPRSLPHPKSDSTLSIKGESMLLNSRSEDYFNSLDVENGDPRLDPTRSRPWTAPAGPLHRSGMTKPGTKVIFEVTPSTNASAWAPIPDADEPRHQELRLKDDNSGQGDKENTPRDADNPQPEQGQSQTKGAV